MPTRTQGTVFELFNNAGASETSEQFAWPGGYLEVIGHATAWGGAGVSLEILAPDGVWIRGNALFLKRDGTTTGLLCPCTLRATTGVGASGVFAWLIAIPV